MNKYLKRWWIIQTDKPFHGNTGDEGATGITFTQSGVTEGDWQENITCYSYGEKGHMKRDCPKERKRQMHVMSGQGKKDEKSDNKASFTQDESRVNLFQK